MKIRKILLILTLSLMIFCSSAQVTHAFTLGGLIDLAVVTAARITWVTAKVAYKVTKFTIKKTYQGTKFVAKKTFSKTGDLLEREPEYLKPDYTLELQTAPPVNSPENIKADPSLPPLPAYE